MTPARPWDDPGVRVLVSTTAGSGHFGPLIPLARACLAAGHQVVVGAPDSFATSVAAAGLEHRPFADTAPDLMGPVFGGLSALSFKEANKVVVAEVFGRLDARAALPGILEIIDEWGPDLVLREPCEFGSLVAARAAGVPQAVVDIGMSEFTDWMVPIVSDSLGELDVLGGLPAGTAVTTMRSTPTLTCVPAALDPTARTEPDSGPIHRFRDDSLAVGHGSLPAPWGDPSQPLVYVSFGSVAAQAGEFRGLYPQVLAAFAAQPVRVLLTTGAGLGPDDLPPAPDNVHVEQWWPQADVMPHAAAVVGHGGFGTTMAAVAAGVPQVVVPLFAFDQRINAQHVAAIGAGLNLDGGSAALPAVPDAVAELLADPSYRSAARRVAEEMAALPTLSDAVTILERVAAH